MHRFAALGNTDISFNELTGTIPAGLGGDLRIAKPRSVNCCSRSANCSPRGPAWRHNNVWCAQEYDINYENITKGELYVTGSLLEAVEQARVLSRLLHCDLLCVR